LVFEFFLTRFALFAPLCPIMPHEDVTACNARRLTSQSKIPLAVSCYTRIAKKSKSRNFSEANFLKIFQKPVSYLIQAILNILAKNCFLTPLCSPLFYHATRGFNGLQCKKAHYSNCIKLNEFCNYFDSLEFENRKLRLLPSICDFGIQCYHNRK